MMQIKIIMSDIPLNGRLSFTAYKLCYCSIPGNFYFTAPLLNGLPLKTIGTS